MNRKTIFFFVSIVLILVLSNLRGVFSHSSETLPDPQRIHGDDLASVPPVEEAIQFFQERIKANPQDAVSYTLLAEQYVRRARETGDASSYQRAEAALRKALQRIPNYGQANVSLASVYYAQHNFRPALELAQNVYEENPGISGALVTIGDAQMALGNYTEAEAAYKELSEQSATPPVLARLAALEEATGDSQQALELMRRAAGEALQAGGTKEGVAWYVLRVGDLYFNMGQPKEAGRYYEAALRVFDHYHLALAGLGKVRAAQGEYDEAISYYQQAIGIIPQPDYLAALGDLYTLTGQPEQAQRQYSTVEYIGKLAELNQQIYNRQLANFYSDHDLHLQEALDLALTELDSRKDIYGYDAAAWAQYKNGNFQEAQSLMKEAMKFNTRDARLYYHAGMIEHARGNDQAARSLLEEALAINPYFSLLQIDELHTTLQTLQATAKG
ncbi:MAG TPA: tetratricopeptide repeat protein [Anaerolineales bacterium]|jgi:tetratricopeptide (TPR) repeat protein|nr:tetratricopeptide repeat protein [Anaerolineales bacterium]